MADNRTAAIPQLTLLGLLKLQLILAPLYCSSLYAAFLAQERETPNSTSLTFLIALACSALFYAATLSAFRLRAFSNNSIFVPALKYGLWYSMLFGLLAWGPTIVGEVAHSVDGFLPKFNWLRATGNLNSLLDYQMLLMGAWKEFHRPLSSLALLLGFYGFIGLATGVCSTTLIQIARLLFPHFNITSR